MRIKLLQIKEYKNLKNLSIKFIDENIDIFIGNNGSGKTNIYEFILKVFRKMSQQDKNFSYEFKLEYEMNIDGQNTTVAVHGDGEKINILIGDRAPHYTMSYTKYTPKNIIVYYSGTSKRLRSIYGEHIVHIKDDHFPLIFTSLLTSSLPRNKRFLEEFFNINITHGIKINMRIKNFFRLDTYLKSEIIQAKDEEDLKYLYEIEKHLQENTQDISLYSYLESYWSEIENRFNILLTHQKKKRMDFLRNLTRFATDISLYENNKYIDIEINTTYINEEGLQEYDIDFFKKLFDVYKGLYLQIKDIKFTRNDIRIPISYKDLSEGETQFILTQGIIELFGDDENLLLLDEADTYLHPSWQRKIIGNLRESKSQYIHILFTTHSPQTLMSVTRKNIFIISKNDNNITYITNPPKSTFGRDINSIVSEAMGIPERPKEIDDLFNEYFKLIAQHSFDKAEKLKSKILEITKHEETFVDDELDFVKAKAILQRIKILGK